MLIWWHHLCGLIMTNHPLNHSLECYSTVNRTLTWKMAVDPVIILWKREREKQIGCVLLNEIRSVSLKILVYQNNCNFLFILMPLKWRTTILHSALAYEIAKSKYNMTRIRCSLESNYFKKNQKTSEDDQTVMPTKTLRLSFKNPPRLPLLAPAHRPHQFGSRGLWWYSWW